jgi:hypothetical protein
MIYQVFKLITKYNSNHCLRVDVSVLNKSLYIIINPIKNLKIIYKESIKKTLYIYIYILAG